MTIFNLDLKKFDGEGAAAGTGSGAVKNPGADNSAGMEEGMQAEGSEGHQAAPEDLEAEFDELISGKYKDIYNSRTKKAIGQRMSKFEAGRDAENAKNSKLFDSLAIRYGLDNPSVDDLISAVDNDKSFLEEAASREGLSPEQFKKMASLQKRATAAERKANMAEKARLRDETNARLKAQADECKAQFPEFDFEKESQNETFRNMLLSGADITSAYKFAHMDELITDGMAKAAKEGARATAEAVKANLKRPQEAGASGAPAASVSVDFSKMSAEEFKDYQDRLMSGEI